MTTTAARPAGSRIEAEVVIPVRWDDVDAATEQDFAGHLELLRRHCDVTVVDGSRGARAELRRARWAEQVRVLAPDPRWDGVNGKVGGALTGIEAARHERVVVADDDVRYDERVLAAVVAALADADLVFPQNYPTDFRSWAWWESGRMLLNRAFAADWPGTCAVRRSTILAAGGWSADVLYENLEMARTVAAAGGRVVHRPDLLVARRPPSGRHFLRQRVRQAYEDQAQPVRLVLSAAVVPAAVALARRPRRLAAAAAVLVAVAEAGRRRAGAAAVFPPYTSLAAPLWVLERGVCTWPALLARVRGGALYNGRRVPVAAHSTRWLSRRLPVQPASLDSSMTPPDTPAGVPGTRPQERGMGGGGRGTGRAQTHTTARRRDDQHRT